MTETTVVDYSKMTSDQLLQEMTAAVTSKDISLLGKLSKAYAAAEAAEAKAKRDELTAHLTSITREALDTIYKQVARLLEQDKFAGAEGVWFAFDAGEKVEMGINPSLRLVKSKVTRHASASDGTRASSYVANPTKSSELLAQVGGNVMFKAVTTVTIDKEEHLLPEGMTFKQAYDYSSNGGWRNRVRMALLKEAGII